MLDKKIEYVKISDKYLSIERPNKKSKIAIVPNEQIKAIYPLVEAINKPNFYLVLDNLEYLEQILKDEKLFICFMKHMLESPMLFYNNIEVLFKKINNLNIKYKYQTYITIIELIIANKDDEISFNATFYLFIHFPELKGKLPIEIKRYIMIKSLENNNFKTFEHLTKIFFEFNSKCENELKNLILKFFHDNMFLELNVEKNLKELFKLKDGTLKEVIEFLSKHQELNKKLILKNVNVFGINYPDINFERIKSILDFYSLNFEKFSLEQKYLILRHFIYANIKDNKIGNKFLTDAAIKISNNDYIIQGSGQTHVVNYSIDEFNFISVAHARTRDFSNGSILYEIESINGLFSIIYFRRGTTFINMKNNVLITATKDVFGRIIFNFSRENIQDQNYLKILKNEIRNVLNLPFTNVNSFDFYLSDLLYAPVAFLAETNGIDIEIFEKVTNFDFVVKTIFDSQSNTSKISVIDFGINDSKLGGHMMQIIVLKGKFYIFNTGDLELTEKTFDTLKSRYIEIYGLRPEIKGLKFSDAHILLLEQTEGNCVLTSKLIIMGFLSKYIKFIKKENKLENFTDKIDEFMDICVKMYNQDEQQSDSFPRVLRYLEYKETLESINTVFYKANKSAIKFTNGCLCCNKAYH